MNLVCTMIMEENKSMLNEAEKDIVFSRTVKAGKRIYYIDVKRNRKEELFITLTESKKTVSGSELQPVVNYEKHKLFLYREDFGKFMSALHEAIAFAGHPDELTGTDTPTSVNEDIKIDIDF